MGAVGLNLTVFWEGPGSGGETRLTQAKVVSEMRERLFVSWAGVSRRL